MAGIAAGIKLSGCTNCKVYAVEPTGGWGLASSLRKHASSRWATLGSVIQDCATLRNNNAVEALIGYN